MKIVLTGGHHSSALPVIAELRARDPKVQLFWLGHRHSQKGDVNDTLEYKEITALDIPFVELQAGKVYKTKELKRLLKVPLGFFQALYLLFMIRPDVILSFGGYLAVPVVIAGWFLGIPSVTHEQTVVVGYANKVIARFAKRILISWKESAVYFPGNKTVLTGIPLRKAIFDVKSTAFEARNSLPTIYITAGKTGAHIINEIIIKTLPELLKFCNVIHQSGDYSVFNDYDRLTEVYKRLETKNSESGTYFLRKFVLEDEIGEAFNKASLVVSRSGAHTVCELLALKKPALLIPIPWVSHNEQNENAKLLKKYGLAEILAEENLTPATFIVNVKKMLTDLKRYGLNASTDNLIHEDAAKLIVSEVVNVAKK